MICIICWHNLTCAVFIQTAVQMLKEGKSVYTLGSWLRMKLKPGLLKAKGTVHTAGNILFLFF
jgi:hypothetical protein